MSSAQQEPLFIVSTGRCGSTMLSGLLSLHPDLLCLSELFTALLPLGFLKDPVDGPNLWHVLSEPRVRHTIWLRLMERGLVIDEFRYPLRAAGRFRETGIPPLLAMTLPLLSDEPDALHDALRVFVRALPEGRLGAQYVRVFEWLCARLGRRVWCERSGASLAYVDALIHFFPRARFVHVCRDGREYALSASRFPPMRLATLGGLLRQKLGVNPYMVAPQRVPESLPPEWRALLPQTFDLDAFERFEIPLEQFGKNWSTVMAKGMAHLRRLPPERVLHVRYESILAAPEAELSRVARFLDPGLVDPAWLAQAAARVRPNPPRWEALPVDVRARLEAACAPGMVFLGALG